MFKLKIMLLLLFLTIECGAKTIIGYEFWFNNATSNRTFVSTESAESISLDTLISCEGLPDGINTLYVRMKDTDSSWSFAYPHVFSKIGNYVQDNQIVAYQYRFDNSGEWTNVDIQNTAKIFELNDSIALSSLEPGIHTFNLRFMDGNNKWSHLTNNYFFTSTENYITTIEYWFNNDYANKIVDNLIPNDTVQIYKEIDVKNLPDGIYQFCYRIKDRRNNWSPSYSQLIFKGPADDSINSVSKVEYWFDDNYTSRNELTINAGQIVNFDDFVTVDPKLLGIHNLNVRIKDTSGNYSSTNSFMFNRVHNVDTNKIAAYRYWFDNEYNNKKTVNLENPDALVTIIDEVQPYYNNKLLNLQAIDSAGMLSRIVQHNFTYTFSYILFGKEVSFQIDPRSKDKFLWDFGDGSFDSVPNPKHIYKTGGAYTVKLKVIDTNNITTLLSRVVQIKGVQSLSIYKGGNNGEVTMFIYGAEFKDSCRVWLSDDNNVKIYPDTLIFVNSNILVARFDFTGQSVGPRDFVIKFPDGTINTAENWFTIETGKADKLDISITGQTAIRFGRSTTLNINIKNLSNVNATGIPLWVIINGGGLENSDIDLSNNIVRENFVNDSISINVDSIPIFFKPDSLYGKPFNGIVAKLFISQIPPEGSLDLPIGINKPDGTFKLSVATEVPIFHKGLTEEQVLTGLTDLQKDEQNQIYSSCAWALVDLLWKLGMELVPEGVPACFKNSLSLGYFGYTKSIKWLYYNESIVTKANMWDLSVLSVSTIASCFYAAALKSNPYVYLFELIGKLIKFEKFFRLGLNFGYNCSAAFDEANRKDQNISVVASFDPNEIDGPKSTLANNYIQGINSFPFKISFENVDSATAPAQEVFIINNIDKTKFDISTFQLGSFAFSNTVINVPPGLREYTVDVDLRSSRGLILRIDAKLDTASGKAIWHFISLDTLTNKFTDDPYAGFLPPNDSTGRGEGSVSYTIQPLANLSNGTEIRNKASIIFDLNAPIETNTWLNTIDNDLPVSSVKELDSIQNSTSFWVNWSGVDTTSAVEYYNVYYSVNNGEYQLWKYRSDTTAAYFTGMVDSTYHFYSIGIDYAGNIENTKTVYDTYTIPKKLLPPVLITPENNQQFVNYKPTFDWSNAEFAESYEIQVSDTSDFSNIVYEKNNVAATNITMTNDTLVYLKDYFWRVRTVNGISKSDWSEIFKFKTQTAPLYVPKEWEFTDSTGISAIVKIPAGIKPKVGMHDMLKGDAIGFFFKRNDSTICAGYGIWNEADLEVTIWGDDVNTQIKDGYFDNENYRIFIWDAQQNKQREAIVSYSSGNIYFENEGYSVLSSLVTNDNQVIVLNPGWNMISSYLYPEFPQLESLLVNNTSNIIIMRNNYGEVYIPSYNINNIINWNTKEGYQIYVSKADTLSMSGIAVNLSETQIILSKGWNIISYLLDFEMDCESAFASLTDDGNLIIVKDNFGNVYIPAYGVNTIGNLEPGQGYLIYVLNADMLVYPGN
jgi:hypothetical protein